MHTHKTRIQSLPDISGTILPPAPRGTPQRRATGPRENPRSACYTAANMADCDGVLHERARAGIRLFNQGRYFEAHEELEAAWRDEKGKIRELYQGILEAGVTYLHITRGNYTGAVKVYGRSMKWLRSWPEDCRGVNVGQLRRDLDVAIASVRQLQQQSSTAFDATLLKPVIWKDDEVG